MSDAPGPPRDPRLEIPEVLRTPVKKPALPSTRVGPDVGSLGEIGKAVAIGVDFLCTFGAGVGLGWGVDWYFKTSPVGLLVGLGLGFLGGTFRLLHRLNKDEQSDRKSRLPSRTKNETTPSPDRRE